MFSLRRLLCEQRWHRPGIDPLTMTLLVLFVFHVVVTLAGGYVKNETFYHVVGLSRPEIFSGKVWQIVSYALLHGDWSHFLLNGLMIYLIGGRIVHILGGKSFLKIFLGGVLVGGLFHLLMQPALPVGEATVVANAPLVGASAGAMALLIALTTLSPQSRMWPLPVSARNLKWGILISTVLFYLITPGLSLPVFSEIGHLVVEGQMEAVFQVSHICHLGGAVWGGFVAWRILRTPITLADLERDRARREGNMAA